MRWPAVAVATLLAIAGAACSSSSPSSSATTTTRAATGATPTTPAPSSTVAVPKTAAERAADAYVWGYPLVVTERTFKLLAQRVPVNRLLFQPAVSTVSSRSIVAPNVDTLYGVAPLDLRGEPYVLTVPAIHDRYYSFQFISAYTDSFAYIGTRATAGRAGTWVITPPGWHRTLPAGVTRLSAPTPQVVVLGRFLVRTPDDVARIHALGDQIRMQPLSAVTGTAAAPAPPAPGAPAGSPQSVAVAGIHFFDELGDALAINPPVDAQDRATMQSFADLGIGPGRHPGTEAGAAVRSALTRGVPLGEKILDRAGSASREVVDGWGVDTRTGVYGHDAVLRAQVARAGWGANVPQEAVYAHAEGDSSGAPFRGTHDYVVHFAAGGLPPVDAFWSVTLYGADHFFVANPIDRYAIGDRTQGLQYGADGSLDIYLAHDAPAVHEANWLPTPTGAFYLSLRLYLPKPSVLDRAYRYPIVRRIR
jgi:hypothetical protein